MTDYPRDEIMRMAQDAIDASPGSVVHFKFTCEQCGERCTLAEPNRLYERGECVACGHETAIVAGGFMLVMKVVP